jgi:hypothetical protein
MYASFMPMEFEATSPGFGASAAQTTAKPAASTTMTAAADRSLTPPSSGKTTQL